MSQVTCKTHKNGREGKPKRQEVIFINSVLKAVAKAEIQLRSPMSKPKSRFLGLEKSHEN